MRRLLLLAFPLALSGCAISQQQEVEMGAQYAQQINSQLPIVRDPEVHRYINLLGNQIARVADTRGLEWHFYVVNSREVNAFAVPGGHVYINRGLIERMNNMSQLAGVLGHEIGHVTERHSVEQMQKQQGVQIGAVLGCTLLNACQSQAAGTALNVGAGALFAKFSRGAENEADRVGVDFVTRAGISPRGIPQTFRILLEERERRPAGVESWFLSHPLEEDRITNTEAMIASLGRQRNLNNLTTDTQNFQSFKRRLAGMPAAPASQARR